MKNISMKTSVVASVIVATMLMTAQADLIVADYNEVVGTSPTYGNVFFSGVSVNIGDVLVVAQAGNKRDNGNNTISLSLSSTANSFTTVHSGDSGTGSAAWLFYSPITEAGTVNISLDTSSATKTVTQATSYWVLRPGSGQSIEVADTAFGVAASTTSLTLDFDYGAQTFSGGLGIVAAATGTETLTAPTGWTTENSGVSKREIYSLSGTSEGTADPSITSGTATDMAAAGAVFYVVPEPSVMAFMGIGAAVMFFRRRRLKHT